MKYLFFILMSLALFSCKKGATNFTFDGTITDMSFGTGLANSEVSIYRYGIAGADGALVATVMTDAYGKFKYQMKRDQFLHLEFVVVKDNYFIATKKVNFKELTVEGDNAISMEVFGKSWVKVHLRGENNDQATMKFYNTIGKFDCSECCMSGEQSISGIIDTTFYCINNANAIYQLKYHLLGTSFHGQKDVTTGFADTTLVELIY